MATLKDKPSSTLASTESRPMQHTSSGTRSTSAPNEPSEILLQAIKPPRLSSWSEVVKAARAIAFQGSTTKSGSR